MGNGLEVPCCHSSRHKSVPQTRFCRRFRPRPPRRRTAQSHPSAWPGCLPSKAWCLPPRPQLPRGVAGGEPPAGAAGSGPGVPWLPCGRGKFGSPRWAPGAEKAAGAARQQRTSSYGWSMNKEFSYQMGGKHTGTSTSVSVHWLEPQRRTGRAGRGCHPEDFAVTVGTCTNSIALKLKKTMITVSFWNGLHPSFGQNHMNWIPHLGKLVCNWAK